MTDEEQKRIFAKNLNYQLSLNNMQQKDLAKAIGVKTTTLNMWCKGNAMPGVGKIQVIADYFRIGKSDLTDEKSDMTISEEYASVSMKIGLQDERFRDIVISYYNMPTEKKDLICDFFEKFIFDQK